MIYLWAAIRTIVVLIGGLVALVIVGAVIGGVVQAFAHRFVAGCLALAGVFGALSLFGHQLASVAKLPRPKLLGTYTRLCCGAIAVLSLAVPLVVYGYTTALRALAPPVADEFDQFPDASAYNSRPAPKPVTDPALLAQLNAPAVDPYAGFSDAAQGAREAAAQRVQDSRPRHSEAPEADKRKGTITARGGVGTLLPLPGYVESLGGSQARTV